MDVFRFLRGVVGAPITKAEGDIPEVEQIIAIVDPIMERYWKRKIDAAVDYIIERLQLYTERAGEEAVDAATTREAAGRETEALLASLEERLGCPLPPAETEAVEEAARTLLAEGALALGYLLSPSSPRLALTGRRDISLMVNGRIAPRRAALRTELSRYLTSRELRGGLRSQIPSELARDWKNRIRELMGSRWTTWGPQTVDAWAYRWHNVGRFEGGTAGGVQRWVAVNPMDNRTTKFCRWVHGKVISARRIKTTLTDYYKAVDQGDIDLMKKLWPLADPGLHVGRFKRIFANVGLPPYHFRCRTVPMPA